MKSLPWAILTAILVAVLGLVFGVAGNFLAPILGIVVIIARGGRLRWR